MDVGQRIARLRSRNNLSQLELAHRAGVPLSTINYIERGVRKGERLSVDTIRRIARALGVSLDYLCGMYDDENETESASRG